MNIKNIFLAVMLVFTFAFSNMAEAKKKSHGKKASISNSKSKKVAKNSKKKKSKKIAKNSKKKKDRGVASEKKKSKSKKKKNRARA